MVKQNAENMKILSTSFALSPRRFRLGFDRESPTVVMAMLGTILVLLAGAITVEVYKYFYGPLAAVVDPQKTLFWGPYHINAYLLEMSPYFNGAGQRLAHRLALIVLAALILLAPLSGRMLKTFRGRSMHYAVIGLVSLVVTAAIFASSKSQPVPYWQILIGLLFCAVVCLPRIRQLTWITQRALAAMCLILLAAATAPALFTAPDLTDRAWADIAFIQMHYSLVLGLGDHLAAGQRLFSDTVPTYGIFFQSLAAAYERHIRPLSAGDYFHLLQAINALYLAIVLYLYHRYSRGKWYLCLAAFALLVPFYHFRQKCLWYPNQAAWRTISFPLALLLCHCLRRWRAGKIAFVLGLFAGIAVLVNVESGVAASAGLVAYIYFRRVLAGAQFMRSALITAFAFIFGGVISLLAFFLIWRLILPPIPDFAQAPRALFVLRLWMATSFGSAEFKWSFIAVAIFSHAVFVLIYTAIAYRRGAPHFASLRAGAAAIIVIWFADYFNRANPWNLCGFFLPYGILLIDLLRMLRVQVVHRRAIATLSAAALAILIFAVVPQLLESWKISNFIVRDGPTVASFHSPQGNASRLVSGVFLPTAGAENLIAQARFLAQSSTGESPFYITQNSFLMPKLSGDISHVPAMDFLWETTTLEKYHDMVESIIESEPHRIYLDSSESLALGSFPYTGIYSQLRIDLSAQYHPTAVKDGWQIWERKRE
jgi:hypothetical protein